MQGAQSRGSGYTETRVQISSAVFMWAVLSDALNFSKAVPLAE